MAPVFSILPDELIVRIFEELDLQGIINCTQTCRLFNEICNSVVLQYRLALEIAGRRDGGTTSPLSVAERLAALKAIEHGWANLSFRQLSRIGLGRSNLWELFGGVLAHGVMSPITRGLSFRELPSAVRGTSGRFWQHSDMGVDIRDFGIDPGQDLAVLIAFPVTTTDVDPASHKFLIHLRAMSTGGMHPKATVPILSFTRNLEEPIDFVIQVMGDFLAILFHTFTEASADQLYIWDWKAGRLITDLMAFPPHIVRMDSFSFLSPRHFVLARFHTPGPCTPALAIYDFLAASTEGSTDPRLVRSFQLPRVAGDTLMSMATRSDPPPECPSNSDDRPFYTAPTSRLLAVSIDLHRLRSLRQESYMLFVHHSSLLEGLQDGTHSDEVTIAWERWGPMKSRIIPTSVNERVWVCYVHGTRYVRSDRDIFTNRSYIRMLDFNPLALEWGSVKLASADGTSSPSDGEHEERYTTIVRACVPTVIPESKSLFDEDIVTTLPYREIRSRESYRHVAVMIDEDCVVGMIRPPTSNVVTAVDLLCV